MVATTKRMKQKFKSIYFQDHPSESARQKHVKIAFGKGSMDLYKLAKSLSSQELRSYIGQRSYAGLQEAAGHNSMSVNAFCLHQIRETEGRYHNSVQQDLPFAEADTPIQFDPIQATFRGGLNEPLHEWYPYLEGYSPEYVSTILSEFAPKAKHVFDPFAGTGTTPITAAQLERQASYCELNPLLQFLIKTKIKAFSLSDRERAKIATRVREFSVELPGRIASCPLDMHLDQAYRDVFNTSRFFETHIYEQVLKARSLIDEIACEHPLLAELLIVAVLGSLIPASNLIRRGDLRYKTETELRRPSREFRDLVSSRLGLIANDISIIKPLPTTPRLICADSRELSKIPFLDIDAVVTSPPYLNGTNYFRNTKIELWFLRALLTSQDLTGFRLRAITAGINDVTVDKPSTVINSAIERLVKRLEDRAYDTRIPRMVQTYFHDMAVVMNGLRPHLQSGAPVLIDIGDSAYGGVHVDTPNILTKILEEQGFTIKKEVVLRRRMSRNGLALRQVLLVLHAPKLNVRHSTNRARVSWDRDWAVFKKNLPHQSGDYAKRNWGHPLHSLCSYQGKMKPSLASHLVSIFVPPGGRMLDPFGGVGTIPFEAALQGRVAWAFDISPAAVQIATAKLQRATTTDCESVVLRLRDFIYENRPSVRELKEAEEIKFNKSLIDYFHPRTLEEVLLARRFFLIYPPNTPAESMVFASLLHILHGNRPYALSRRSHPITPFAPTGPTEYRSLIERVQTKVARSLAVEWPDSFIPGNSIYQDATETWPQSIDNLDAVITSPPFFDSTRFYLTNWMRLWFSGWAPKDFKHKPLSFIDERQKHTFNVYDSIFWQARERLKPGGVMVLHLGKSRKCDMAPRLAEVAKPWFKVVDIFSESVGHCESHGIRDKGAVVEHSYLVLE